MSLEYLVPIALERLNADPFIEGDFYEGDLLCNALKISAPFWASHADLHRRTTDLARAARARLNTRQTLPLRGGSNPVEVALNEFLAARSRSSVCARGELACEVQPPRAEAAGFPLTRRNHPE